jgi:hypothetical protein
MDTKRRLSSVLFAGVIGALCFASPPAFAATQPGTAGIPWIASEASYFSRTWSKVEHIDTVFGTPRLLLYPLVTTSTGSKSYSAVVDGAGGSVSCASWVFNSSNGLRSWSGWIDSTGGENWSVQTLSLGSRTIYAGDVAQIECSLARATSYPANRPAVYSVNWSN